METIQITQEQLAKMKHALGLNYNKKPSRNYFYTNSNNPLWTDLVSKGLATSSGSWSEEKSYFRLTFEGAKLIFTKPMSRKYFNDLP